MNIFVDSNGWVNK